MGAVIGMVFGGSEPTEADCLCGSSGADEFGNHERIEHPDCPIHGGGCQVDEAPRDPDFEGNESAPAEQQLPGAGTGEVAPMQTQLTPVVAKHDGKCQDRCGLRIHAGHDEIERGHYGWRHVDCDKAQAEAWIRERFAAGDVAADVQIKLLSSPHLTPDQRMAGSLYALDFANGAA